MRALFFAVALSIVTALSGVCVCGQTPQPSPSDAGITPNQVIGEVKAIDATANRIVVKTDAGSEVAVMLTDKTSYLRVAPGEKDLKNAAKIAFTDVGEGDRVLALGKVADDHKSVPARVVVVMTKGDIAKKHEAERAEWRKRGMLGVVTALKSDSKEITISTRTAMGSTPVSIPVTEKVDMRRYAPDSIKFSDAKASNFGELQVGDQLRALGERSTDGTHFTAEKIVTGAFRTVGGIVTAVNVATGEIKVNDLQTKKPLTIVIKSDSVLRKFPSQAEMGGMMGMMGGGRPGGAGGQGAPAQSGQPPAAGNKPPQPSGGPPSGPGGGPGNGPRAGGGGFNINDILERLPTISLADVKAGDTIVVSSTKGADPTRLTAISLVNGADTLLAMLAPRPAPGAAAPNPAAGLGSGISFGIGLP